MLIPLLLLAQQAVAFTNVTVLPMDRERTLADQTVIVVGQRITAVGPAGQVKVPDGATRIDGRGKFLMPGLGEMHAHIPPGNATDADIEKVLAYFALNGVTTVRGMLGAPRHLVYRERAAKGEVLSPTIYTTGPSLNGTSVPTVDDRHQGGDRPEGGRLRPPQDPPGDQARGLRRHRGHGRTAWASGSWATSRSTWASAGRSPRGRPRSTTWTASSRRWCRRPPPSPATQSAFFGYNLVPHVEESRLAELVQPGQGQRHLDRSDPERCSSP